MDTKRNSQPQHIFDITNRIVKTIEDWQPDVVITSDDNVAKYLIKPHYKDDKVPFVFCGINWTVDEYGFPYSNVTGMVEIAPVRIMLEEAISLSNQGRRALYLGASNLTERKNAEQIKRVAKSLDIEIDVIHTSQFTQWTSALEKSSEYDFIVMGSSAGIANWSDSKALIAALTLNTKVSVTNHKALLPYSAFGFINLASEQGNWAGDVALRILNGTSPSEIPLASNKMWDVWVNELALLHLNIEPPSGLLKKAKRLRANL